MTLPSDQPNPPVRSPLVTVILLSWKRVPNIVKIVSTLIESPDVAEIRIWNNNPDTELKIDDFDVSQTLAPNIKIVNSEVNLLFQARYRACVDISTPFCFFQDDDYLIRPALLESLAQQALKLKDSPMQASIHLLPRSEYISTLSTRLESIDGLLHTSFAWLGYGTLVPAQVVKNFAELLNDPALGLQEDEKDMADNYFTILRNVQPEIWMYEEESLGHDHAFTVGQTGDERNWKYIQKAVDRLAGVLKYPTFPSSFTNRSTIIPDRKTSPIARIATKYTGRLIETNISLFSKGFDLDPLPAVTEDSKIDIEALALGRGRSSSQEEHMNFVEEYPFMAMTDGNESTFFRSSTYGIAGDYITIRGRFSQGSVLKLIFRNESRRLIDHLVVQTTNDMNEWINVPLTLKFGDIESKSESTLAACLFDPGPAFDFGHMVRVVLEQDVECRWEVVEFVVQSRSAIHLIL